MKVVVLSGNECDCSDGKCAFGGKEGNPHALLIIGEQTSDISLLESTIDALVMVGATWVEFRAKNEQLVQTLISMIDKIQAECEYVVPPNETKPEEEVAKEVVLVWPKEISVD